MTFATIMDSSRRFLVGFEANETEERIKATGGVLPFKSTHLQSLFEISHQKLIDIGSTARRDFSKDKIS